MTLIDGVMLQGGRALEVEENRAAVEMAVKT
jgi:hypothetical protein